MNLLKRKWVRFKNKEIQIRKEGGKLFFRNNTAEYGFAIVPKIYKYKNQKLRTKFEGEVIDGNSTLFYLLDLNRNILLEQTLNSLVYKEFEEEQTAIVAIKILPYSEVCVTAAEVAECGEINLTEGLTGDILIVAPSYPSQENKYLCGFVHSRVKAYQAAGIRFDLAVCHEYREITRYSFEGIDVLKIPFAKLRIILQKRRYKKILMHFFDRKYANILDSCDLTESELLFWIHGPETLFWDWPKFTTQYFRQELSFFEIDYKSLADSDALIKRYNGMPNVKWIFVSDWIRKRSEELLNIRFRDYAVIPNFVDGETFVYTQKEKSFRKKVYFLRRFDDCNKYAIDVNVRTILELSKRPCFSDMEFNLYGTGNVYDRLVAPLRQFENVHFHPKFFSHEEIADIHKEHGIALFATRYDAQGVSMCEAAMSGLAVVSSRNEAIEEFLPDDLGLLADTENYKAYADIIEGLYADPDHFVACCNACHDKVRRKCGFHATIQKEIELICSDTVNRVQKPLGFSCVETPVLSVVVPSYNVAQYLRHTVHTVLDHENAPLVEVIIVNDGSTDETEHVAKELQAYYNKHTSIVKIIEKENGGHGSAINAGLQAANGKYVRVIDGDDWVNSGDFCKLIDILRREESDIVLTDYSEDLALPNQLIPRKFYQFMAPGVSYDFEDLCYEDYGFGEWGPILATGNYKMQMLKDTAFRLTEKSYYVDMEFDMYAVVNAKTVSYYPLDVYRYFIGRENQSISRNAYLQNKDQHERVLMNIIDYRETRDLSTGKKTYILNKLIVPMVRAQYLIVTEYQHRRKDFLEFDAKLRRYEDVYNVSLGRYVTLMRKTKGLLLPIGPLLVRLFRKG